MTEVTQPRLSDTQRMVNVGLDIELKKLGTVNVRELSLESIIKLAEPVKQIVDEFSKSDGDGNIVMLLAGSPSLIIALKKVAASATDKTEEDFRDMGIKDWLKLVQAFKEVMDMEEISELFFSIVPKDLIKGLVSPNKE